MGKRKIGVLTPWQRSYIHGQVIVDKNREKVEDYYLRKILDNLDVIYEDVMLLLSWADKKNVKTKPEGEVFRIVVLGFLKGKKPLKWKEKAYRYDVSLKCPNPNCGIEFNQAVWVSKDGVRIGKASTFGFSREQTNSAQTQT
jgi:hypothetical protein